MADKHYPAWRYSATGSVRVETKADDKALGPGWYDSPKRVPLIEVDAPRPWKRKKESA